MSGDIVCFFQWHPTKRRRLWVMCYSALHPFCWSLVWNRHLVCQSCLHFSNLHFVSDFDLSESSCQHSSFFLWNSPDSTPHCNLWARTHFWDYITFSKGTATQAFEKLGFSRALTAFISQELALTLSDVHWSWRPLKENSLKKTAGPRKPA